MAGFTSLGIGSGLDLSSLVSGLLAAERQPVENSLNRRESRLTAELSGVGLMRSALSEFQTSLSALSSAENLASRQIGNSNTAAITASGTGTTPIGNYKVDVTNLAESQSLASSVYSDVNQVVGTGTVTIRFGTITGPGFTSFAVNPDKATQTLTFDGTNNTLSGVRDYINNNDFGVSASIINDGTGYRLTLISQSSGEDSALEITVDDTGDGNDTDASGLSNLAYNASATNLTQTQAAENAALTINGLAVASTSNVLTEAIEGMSLTLKEETDGTVVNISISEDTTTLRTSIEDLIESYNSMKVALNELGAISTDTQGAGLLVGDSTLRNFNNSIRSLLTSPVAGLTGSVTALSTIGIRTASDGTLSISNSTAFNTALSDNPTEVTALFAPVGQTTDSLIKFNDSTSTSIAGNYGISIDTIATQGSIEGAGGLGFPLVIDADNDEISVSVDGKTSGVVSITQASYASGAALATEIQSTINSSSLLVGDNKSVSVSFNSTLNSLVITSNSYGSDSKVNIESIDTNTTAELGFSAVNGVDGVDVEGAIGGVTATGEGQKLTTADGLSVNVLGGSIGSRGSLTFSRGFIELMDSLLTGYLESAGVIGARETGLNNSLSDITEERAALDVKMSSVEARLVAQFSKLDTLIAQFQTTGNFLSNQLSNLPGFTFNSDNN